MKSTLFVVALLVLGTLVFVGCSSSTDSSKPTADHSHSHKHDHTDAAHTDTAEIAKAMAELTAPDRALAQAQRICPVSDGSMLGSMGKPYKVIVDGQPVFLCCESCKEDALKDPKATLAKVEKFKKDSPNTSK